MRVSVPLPMQFNLWISLTPYSQNIGLKLEYVLLLSWKITGKLLIPQT